MYIKDVTIEGFKSYAHRVHISAFDPRFNAITGMNGTGKSNILDAICFVLGISNLSQVLPTYYYLISESELLRSGQAVCSTWSTRRARPGSQRQWSALRLTIVTRPAVPLATKRGTALPSPAKWDPSDEIS